MECQRVFLSDFSLKHIPNEMMATVDHSLYHSSSYSSSMDLTFIQTRTEFFVIPQVKNESFLGTLGTFGFLHRAYITAHIKSNSTNVWLIGGVYYTWQTIELEHEDCRGFNHNVNWAKSYSFSNSKFTQIVNLT